MTDTEPRAQLSGDERVILSRYDRGDMAAFPLPAEGRIALKLWGAGLLARVGTQLLVTERGREVLERVR